jgi:uncharacterized protein (DUF58 family)
LTRIQVEKIDLKQVREFGNIELLARQLVEGFITGLHKSPFHGFSVEFAEHRLYNTGESTRHVDWKVFARTDRLYTKRYEEETNLRCQLVVDVSPSMYYPTVNNGKITFSIMAAASIAYLLQKQKDAVSLCTFSEAIEVHTPTRSAASHLHKLFLLMEGLLKRPKVPVSSSAVSEVLHQLADKIAKRSLVVVFSDMFDKSEEEASLFSALQHLKHNQHEVLLFHVTDQKTEQAFDFEERPYEFVDVETGEKLRIQPGEVRQEYLKRIAAFAERLRLRCGQYKIDLVEADISEGFHPVLYAYLIKRSKMK